MHEATSAFYAVQAREKAEYTGMDAGENKMDASL